MRIGAILPWLASSMYYTVWPRLRPGGYLGRLRAASQERAALEWDSPGQVWSRQRTKLNALLEHAVRDVPYYRTLAQAGKLPQRIDRPEDLSAVPVLTKDIVREQGDALLAESFPRDLMHRNATGGSTGAPVHFWSDEPSLLLSNAGESWALTAAGLSRRSSLAFFWGAARFERSAGKDFRDKIERLITNRIFIDCFRMNEQDLHRAHRQLQRFGPAGIVGYSSALVELAVFLRRQGIQPDYPRQAIISAAETLDPVSRRNLETTFGVPVYDRYGSREAGLIAVECDRHQGLHIDCENVFVELLDDPAGAPMQRIIVTKLNQFGMPLIRYDIEDLAEGPISTCSCGRGYPVLKRIVGRVTEMIRFRDGGCLPGELFPHLLKDCGVATYQVTQAVDYSVDVALVKLPEQTPQQDERLRQVITQKLGASLPITIRYVDEIDRSATGKLLPVISHAPRVGGREKGEGS